MANVRANIDYRSLLLFVGALWTIAGVALTLFWGTVVAHKGDYKLVRFKVENVSRVRSRNSVYWSVDGDIAGVKERFPMPIGKYTAEPAFVRGDEIPIYYYPDGPDILIKGTFGIVTGRLLFPDDYASAKQNLIVDSIVFLCPAALYSVLKCLFPALVYINKRWRNNLSSCDLT